MQKIAFLHFESQKMISFTILIVIIKPSAINNKVIKIRIGPGKSGRKAVNITNEMIRGTAPSNVEIKSVLKHSIKKMAIHKITRIITTSTFP